MHWCIQQSAKQSSKQSNDEREYNQAACWGGSLRRDVHSVYGRGCCWGCLLCVGVDAYFDIAKLLDVADHRSRHRGGCCGHGTTGQRGTEPSVEARVQTRETRQ